MSDCGCSECSARESARLAKLARAEQERLRAMRCVAACAGVPDAALTPGALAAARADAARLAAALRDLHLCSAPGMPIALDVSRDNAAVALAAHDKMTTEGR